MPHTNVAHSIPCATSSESGDLVWSPGKSLLPTLASDLYRRTMYPGTGCFGSLRCLVRAFVKETDPAILERTHEQWKRRAQCSRGVDDWRLHLAVVPRLPSDCFGFFGKISDLQALRVLEER